MRFTLKKQERLKSRKLIERLYKEGKFIKIFPFSMLYLQTSHTSTFPAQVGVSVSKKKFKKAVDRNRIKRLMRESYRLQKQIVYQHLDKPYIFMILYIDKEKWSYKDLLPKMEKLLLLFISKVKTVDSEKK